MNDMVIEIMHGDKKVTLFILERGKKEKVFNLKSDKEVADYIIKYFAGD